VHQKENGWITIKTTLYNVELQNHSIQCRIAKAPQDNNMGVCIHRSDIDLHNKVDL
jgi:hypothetical protein